MRATSIAICLFAAFTAAACSSATETDGGTPQGNHDAMRQGLDEVLTFLAASL